jgi:hypothetical protein
MMNISKAMIINDHLSTLRSMRGSKCKQIQSASRQSRGIEKNTQISLTVNNTKKSVNL